MAAEYKPDLREAVDSLVFGPEEARPRHDRTEINSIPVRLRNWAKTYIRRWLLKSSRPQEPGLTPQREFQGLPEPKRTELERGVYTLYEDISRRHRAYSTVDPNRFSVGIPVDPDERYVDLEIFGPDKDLTKRSVEIRISKHTLRAYEFAVVDLTPDGIQRIDRVTVFEESQGVVKKLAFYSPAFDLLALQTIGEFAKQEQWKKITGEGTDL